MSTLAARAMSFDEHAPSPSRPVVYPESDGEPMAENTKQYNRIVTAKGNLDQVIPDFVAGDLLWYPVQGSPEICVAPDVLVAPGRPKGHRGSYLQWQEGDLPPRVVFEFWSPSNTLAQFIKKFAFYQQYGVDEFYIYDEDRGYLAGWIRNGAHFNEVADMNGWTSPLLGCRFELVDGDLQMYRPDGSRFLSFDEMEQARVRAEDAARLAKDDAAKAKDDAAKAKDDAAKATMRADALAQRLRELGIDPDSIG